MQIWSKTPSPPQVCKPPATGKDDILVGVLSVFPEFWKILFFLGSVSITPQAACLKFEEGSMCLICFWTPPDESMNGKVSKPDGMASVKRIRGGVCIFYSPLPHPNLPWPCLVCLRLKVQPCCSLLFAMTSATVLSCFFADLSNPTRPQKLKHKLPSSFVSMI